MYPYNRALNRSLRRSKKSKQTDSETSSNMSGSDSAVDMESDIVWDPSEYKLTYLLDNFKLPQIVRVVEGFMLSEDDSLASGTVLTIHGQQTIEQICGLEEQGLSREVNIPLNCSYKVKITVPNRHKIYRTIKDLCNASPLPKCVIVQKKISVSGNNIPAGRCLIVNTITRNHADAAFGLLVSTADNEMNSFVLPLKVEGNFKPCPFPKDQFRSYFIRELAERPLPFWVEFVQSKEKNPAYGPHLGVIKLFKLFTSNVVYATSVIDGEKYAISFSRDLPVTIEVARGMLDNTATYVRRVKAANEQVEMDVLSHLTETSPYSEEFTSSVYENVKALREASKLKDIMHISSYSTDSKSASSDISYGEDAKSIQDRYIMTYRSHDMPSINNGSTSSRNSQERETVSCSSAENISLSSVDSREAPAVDRDTKTTPQNVASKHTDVNQNDYDSEDDGYEKVADWMDRPKFRTVKQRGTQKRDNNSYSYPEWQIGASFRPLHIPPEVAPRLPRSEQTKDQTSPAEHGRSRLTSLESAGTNDGETDNPYVPVSKFLESDHIRGHVPETLGCDIPFDGFFTILDKSDGISIKSDEISVVSDYQSVKSENDSDSNSIRFIDESDSICESFHSKATASSVDEELSLKQADTESKKPEVPKRPAIVPPKPLPRRGKLSVKKSIESKNDTDKRASDDFASVSEQNNVNNDNNNDVVFTDAKLSISGGVFESNKNEHNQIDDKENEFTSTEEEHRCSEQVKPSISEDHIPYSISNLTASLNSDGEICSEFDDREKESAGKILKSNIIGETEEGVCLILDELQLSEFKDSFKENQINGQLLTELDEEDFVNDIGLTLFQARKLRLYIKGWRLSKKDTANEKDPVSWSVNDTVLMMESINLKSFAAFCADNQVDGQLLKELLDDKLLQCLKEAYNVKLNNLEEKKLKRFVKDGWRPDRSLKR